MKIETIVVTVTFEDEGTHKIASASCAIKVGDVNEIRVVDLTDACQRAVAHCIDELEPNL